MRTKILILGLVCLFIFSTIFSQHTVSTSKVWYAPLLKKYSPNGITILNINSRIKLDNLPCLPKDITKFNIIAEKVDSPFGLAFQIEGTLNLGKIVSPFYRFFNYIQKKEYLLIFRAFIFSPNGKILWQQKGYAIGNSWVSIDGDKVKFKLINSLEYSIRRCTLLIIAFGNIFMSDFDEPHTILGIKKIDL